jgi:methylated-DNA-protein-cysteine methyltransferase related protein
MISGACSVFFLLKASWPSNLHGLLRTYEKIYAAVRRIPKGKVATYGQIAKIAKCSGPRQVGYALHALPENHKVPWHRVVNAQGKISLGPESESRDVQRLLLEAEGVEFDAFDRIPLQRYRFSGRL